MSEELSLQHRSRITDDPTAPLVLFIHGRAGDDSVMWAFRQTVPDYFHIISPQAFTPDPIGGFSWWRIDHDHFGCREYALERLKLFIDQAIEYYKLKPRRIIAIGFSQGAGLLSLLLHREPNRLDGCALLSGFVMNGKPDLVPGQSPKTTIFMAHGTKDSVIPIDRAYEGKSHLEDMGFEVEFIEEEVDHKMGTAGMRAMKEWLRKFGDEH